MSNLWAINATKKKKNDHVIAGSSKWVSSELNNQLSISSNSIEQHYNEIVNQNDYLENLLSNLENGVVDLSFLNDDEDDKKFESRKKNIPPRISDEKREKDEVDLLNVSFVLPSPKSLAVVKNLPKGSPLRNENVRENEIDEPRVSRKRSSLIFEDDSFQAISKAIRKSTAGKSLTNSSNNNKSESHKSESHKPKSPAMKQESPDSKSAPVKLPDESPKVIPKQVSPISKAPLSSVFTPVENTNKIKEQPPPQSSLGSTKTPRSRSSAFISLPAREPIIVKSATKPRKSTIKSHSRMLDKLDFESSFHEVQPSKAFNDINKENKIDILNANVKPATKFEMNDQFKLSPVRLPQKFQPKPIFESRIPEINNDKNKTMKLQPPINLTHKDRVINSPTKSPQKQFIPSSTEIPIRSPIKTTESTTVWSNIEKYRALSPIKSPVKNQIRSTSRSRSPTRLPPAKLSATPKLSSPIERKNSMPRRTKSPEPSISKSTASTTASASRNKSKKSEGRKIERNRFLTTSLIPNNNESTSNDRKSTNVKPLPKKSLSPVRPVQLPPLRKSAKKSMMEIRSEEAALKPKQRIVLNYNHVLKRKSEVRKEEAKDTPLAPKPQPINHPPPPSDQPRQKKPKTGNAVALPDAARGIFKRKDNTKKPIETPKRRIFDTNLTKYSPNTLPEVLSDNDFSPSKKILQPWARTPELDKTILKFSTMNPNNFFPAPPKIDINKIFNNDRIEKSPTTISSSTVERHGYDKRMGYH
ncbi:unnamed protein product [Candida verbasci]|uniref:Inner centromere protein ARK-binding domain-containing protein n=1 Tax=Candida verbasci TaxID=1227364 RepID=A0A9W4TUI1_9ASCO|nr:unnamed protein product [Candida verbasci]